MSSADIPPGVPGKSGLILGDILGRNAGETCTELTLPLLPWAPLAMSLGVFLAVGPVEPGPRLGLALAEAAAAGLAKTGEGSGWDDEALAEPGSDGDWVGVAVSSLGGCGFEEKLTDSGNSNDSMLSGIPRSCGFDEAELFALEAGSLIREAGVAGDGFPWMWAGIAGWGWG